MGVLLAVNASELSEPAARPALALALVGAALLVTTAATALLGSDPLRLLSAPMVIVEVAVACALEIGDELAYNGVAHPQTLSSAWPLAGVLTAGIAFRARGGVAAGVAVGLGRGVGLLVGPAGWTDRHTVSVLSSVGRVRR